MQTLEELKARIDHLRRISPAGSAGIFSELEAAIEAYLKRDGDFELQVNKTLDKVIAESFHYGLIYQYMELMPEWINRNPQDYPKGYDDVSILFDADGVFEEIMTISDSSFRAGFYTENTNNDGVSQTEWRNRYVDDWIQRLQAAMSNEVEGLKEIMSYCANRSYAVEYAMLFEELGDKRKEYDVRHYAKDIFLTKNYGWLIETFDLKVYKPSYMKELANWTDNDTGEVMDIPEGEGIT